MKILIIGGDSRIAKILIPALISYNEVTITTKDSYDLSEEHYTSLGKYDCVIVCACDFKKGRSDEDQQLCWDTNVTGIKTALSNTKYKQVIFLSSYLSGTNTAYGRQKKAVEDWIKKRPESYYILRIDPINDDEGYEKVASKILEGVGCYENRGSYVSL